VAVPRAPRAEPGLRRRRQGAQRRLHAQQMKRPRTALAAQQLAARPTGRARALVVALSPPGPVRAARQKKTDPAAFHGLVWLPTSLFVNGVNSEDAARDTCARIRERAPRYFFPGGSPHAARHCLRLDGDWAATTHAHTARSHPVPATQGVRRSNKSKSKTKKKSTPPPRHATQYLRLQQLRPLKRGRPVRRHPRAALFCVFSQLSRVGVVFYFRESKRRGARDCTCRETACARSVFRLFSACAGAWLLLSPSASQRWPLQCIGRTSR
jgi:hypothetical protein